MTKYIWERKGLHLLAFVLPLSYYYFFSKFQFTLLTGILLGIACIIEILRFKNPKFRSLFYKIVGKMLWKHESKTITGATTFMISTFICALLFSKIAVVVGLLFLTFGDTVAHLIGKSGKIKVWAKTVEGGIAFLVIGIIIVLLIPEIEFFPGAICAFVACIVELFPKIDDNLAIPLIACPLIHFLL